MAGLNLGDEQLERYARHIVLPEIGGAGQARLLASHVAVIGAGGIGSPVIQYLAAAGVGRLTIVDDDRIDLSNLQRQTLFGSAQLGERKVEAAADAVARLTPDCQVFSRAERIDAANAARLLAGVDVVVDGSDNFATRLAVADACLAARIPLVSAAVGRFDGQLAVFRGWETGKPCYRCLVGSDPDRNALNCAEAGILGAVTGVVGSLAAVEVLRSLVPFGEDMAGRLLLVDLLSMRFRSVSLPADPGCATCAV
jgi:molybdopterin/thiamine biosynthesis adenylyltransferase